MLHQSRVGLKLINGKLTLWFPGCHLVLERQKLAKSQDFPLAHAESLLIMGGCVVLAWSFHSIPLV